MHAGISGKYDTEMCSTSIAVSMNPGVFALTIPSFRFIIAANWICFVDIKASLIIAFMI
jgi:hypothetical protein